MVNALSIAVINDDDAFLHLMQDLLTEEGYSVTLVHQADHAYEVVRELGPDVIVLDIRMDSPETGWQLLEVFKLDPVLGTKRIIICSADLFALKERAVWLNAHGISVLPKPFGLDDILTMLRTYRDAPRAG